MKKRGRRQVPVLRVNPYRVETKDVDSKIVLMAAVGFIGLAFYRSRDAGL
jgi:hypothetical protein